MKLRKFIQEQIGQILSENNFPGKVIKGFEILNYFPFNKLPDTRDMVNWSNRGVNGWGDVYLPAIDGNGMQQITSKDDVSGHEPWAHPKTGHVIQNAGYIEDFKKAFGEEPMFMLDPAASWFGKVQVINEPYLQRKDLHNKAVQDFGTQGD